MWPLSSSSMHLWLIGVNETCDDSALPRRKSLPVFLSRILLFVELQEAWETKEFCTLPNCQRSKKGTSHEVLKCSRWKSIFRFLWSSATDEAFGSWQETWGLIHFIIGKSSWNTKKEDFLLELYKHIRIYNENEIDRARGWGVKWYKIELCLILLVLWVRRKASAFTPGYVFNVDGKLSVRHRALHGSSRL